MDKLKAEEGQSKDIVSENMEMLKQIFPAVFTEGKVDFDALRAELGEYAEDQDERYRFTWNGKAMARRIAQTPSSGTLRPCPEESVDWENTQNLFIEGDNLEVLKLLQKSYHKKVKMIYIDPPYNTGKEFIYPDRYQDNLDTYLAYTGQKDAEGRKFSTNTETSGRFHTNWLNMMYPRLKLARNLLRDDGVIFISIDDNEVANLRKICDEIFGEENFVANIVWQKKYAVSNDDPSIAPMHDHIIAYKKTSGFQRLLLPRTEKQLQRYKNSDDDPRGLWSSDNYVSNKSRYERPTLWYAIKHPKTGEDVWPDENAVWRYSPEKHEQMEKENRLYWGPDESYKKPRLKRFLSEIQDGIVPSTWWTFSETGHNDEGQKETGLLLGKKIFSTPKPVRLIDRITDISVTKEDLVLDFFAGSAATAHSIINQNCKDSGNRKFIMIQLPEPCDEKSEAFKAGYKTIADIGKERIRRVIQKIKEEKNTQNQLPGMTEKNAPPDLGFKVFKLDSSNIKTWDPDIDRIEDSLLDAVNNIKADRTEDDILCEILLKYGLDLTVPMEKRNIAEKTVYSIGTGALIICLDADITLDTVEGIAKLKQELQPEIMRVVFRDTGFKDDVVKTNAVQILKQYGIDDVKSL
ncbi:MAG: site-specific DNA-methyltransferase [Desulfococcaceae bacterium]|jgi:adenine-specific DNA-methyltransferase|nr:site-specific DNA-methyltransferase [Desulfococcaceae bacterium]